MCNINYVIIQSKCLYQVGDVHLNIKNVCKKNKNNSLTNYPSEIFDKIYTNT